MELRADGSRVHGVAVRYGDTAMTWRGAERVRAGAFGDVSTLDVILNRQHDRSFPLARTRGGGLELRDSATALAFTADLVPTEQGRDALALVRTGVLQGASLEFWDRELQARGDATEVTGADLVGIGLVDRPAYQASEIQLRLQVRQAGGLAGAIPYGALEVISAVGKRRKRRVLAGAFVRPASSGPVPIVTLQLGQGSSARPLASTANGSLKLRGLDDGAEAIGFEVTDLPDVSYAADAVTLVDSGLLHPVLRYRVADTAGAFRDVPEPGNAGVDIQNVNKATLTGINLLNRAPMGSEPEISATRPRRQRRHYYF